MSPAQDPPSSGERPTPSGRDDPSGRAGDGGSSERHLLVTGAAGFLGSHLCERLLADGHEVWGLDNFDPVYSPAAKRDNLREALRHPRMHLVEGDIRDGVLLEGLLADRRVDTAVHLAAYRGILSSIEDPEHCFDVNVLGTLTLLQAMRRQGVRRLVFASTASVYGENGSSPVDESTATDRPISPFAASKRAGELLGHVHHHLYDLSAHVLRFFTVFGPRQGPDLAAHKFARLMSQGRPVTLYGDGESRRDYLYISDAVDGIVLSLERLWTTPDDAPEYQVINLGTSVPVKLVDVVRRLAERLEVQPIVESLPLPPGDPEVQVASIERARELLGHEPRVALEEGLERFLEWYATAAGPPEEQQKAVTG